MGHRKPYRPRSGHPAEAVGGLSEALAENLRDYRLLRHVTQSDLSARMSTLGHNWGRSTVSAVEGNGRNVTVDELGGLAISLGTSIGQLLDPTGPDHSRMLSLNAGLPGPRGLLRPDLAHLWSISRIVVSLGEGEEAPLTISEARGSTINVQRVKDPDTPRPSTRQHGVS